MSSINEYNQYVKAYAKTNGITEIQAESHLVVKLYKEYLNERDNYSQRKESINQIIREQEQVKWDNKECK